MKIPTPITGDISLYFHIPFCSKKCPYCHFFVIQNDLEKQQILLSALLNEISKKVELLENKKIVSIYFGGGTPFLFQSQFFKKILQKIHTCAANIANDVEITIEANPEDINIEKVKALKEIGINRFSIGIQTLDDELLKLLGRSHNSSKVFNALEIVHKCEIENISIDLMYEIPKQTTNSWEKTLSHVPSLPITHISLYNLTIEPNTSFFRQKEKLTLLKPTNDDAKLMLTKAIETFEEHGFKRYEISAFAKDNNYSKHNTGYWLYRPFIGYGPSAFSYYNNERFQNACNFKKYIDAIFKQKSAVDFVDNISFLKKIKEAFAISLRLIQGVHIPSFESKWGNIPSDIKKTIDKLYQQGYLQQSKDNIRLTSKGLFFYDTVALEII